MDAAGRIIASPVLRDRITFLKTASETSGEYLRFQVELEPGGGILMHYHTTFTERFEVVDGELGINLNDEHLHLQAGQSVTVPTYAAHRFYNRSSQRVTFLTEVRPARQFEKNLRISYGLARDGKTDARGIPSNLLDLAVIFHFAETYIPGFPDWMQRLPFAVLWLIVRLVGVDKKLYRYLETK